MTQDPQPNLFAIQDLASRQAHKLTWDALNALRVEKRALEDSVATLQSQVDALNSSATGAASVPSLLSLLNSQVNIASDHPFLSMTLSADQSIPDSVATQLAWDVERYPLAGIHSTSSDNTKVFIGNKPGVWLSVLCPYWNVSAVGVRITDVRGLGSLIVDSFRAPGFAGAANTQPLASLVITTGPNDTRSGYVTATVFQNSGGPLTVLGTVDATSWTLFYLGPLGTGSSPR